jgi:hypothetical protein
MVRQRTEHTCAGSGAVRNGGVRGQKARFEAMCGAPEASAFSADEAHIEITEHADPAMAERATAVGLLMHL